ncbi:hypothetical protein SAMN05216388_1011134 [Halorientalis persicus]|jgi:hypothetical protein|uniref:DUF7573 domain-containing protein n=1 Tax=Halorientalis persicus TaxID=1367881 RepID=A0A1H8P2F5_9EURY|nr:hypothetical protein [Halorientalis persicus]SEO36119.1 hypothetical protein SAMN05216388_1011134 [Halorientalis persicus]
MDDASLDEFTDASDDADADSDGAGAGDDDTDPADEPATDAVDPAVSTYAWSGDGAVCAVCDDSVARRWRDGDDLVCPDCKEW